jgi:TPR repeat protein
MTQPTAAVPAPRATVSLTRDEIAALLKRGQDLIAAGDIASARLMLTHLAEAGDAQASFILAGTFDAAVLAKLRVVGAQPDAEKARIWYARAAELGSLEAKQRLQSATR